MIPSRLLAASADIAPPAFELEFSDNGSASWQTGSREFLRQLGYFMLNPFTVLDRHTHAVVQWFRPG
jgi:hypothetical protein